MRRSALRLYASRLAADLRLPLRVDPIEAVLKRCELQVLGILVDFERDAACTSLSLLAELVANKLRTSFEIIRTDDDLNRVRDTHLENDEIGFARLEHDLGPGMYGLTIRLLNPEPWGMRFVSVIDCRGAKRHREFYTKWHELSHLLVLTDQMRLVFRRTHEKRSNPEEQLIDLIAGRCGFHRALVERFATAPISFDLLDRLRATLCPDASRQAAMIGFVNSWPAACILVRAELALKAAEERAADEAAMRPALWPRDLRETLRARHLTMNDSARAMNLGLFRNMRIPERSVIARVFAGEADEASALEDMSWWERGGTHLPARRVHVTARRAFDGVDALLLPIL
jgi:hypothetical protein